MKGRKSHPGRFWIGQKSIQAGGFVAEQSEDRLFLLGGFKEGLRSKAEKTLIFRGWLGFQGGKKKRGRLLRARSCPNGRRREGLGQVPRPRLAVGEANPVA